LNKERRKWETTHWCSCQTQSKSTKSKKETFSRPTFILPWTQ